jgi:3-isopropylmalate dehydrogenase
VNAQTEKPGKPIPIAVIPGDGIGVEVTREASRALRLVCSRYGVSIELREYDYGAERWLRDKVGLPAGALEDLRDHHRAILFGALGDPRIPDMAHGREILLGLRFGLDLFINLRPVRLLDPRLTPLKDRGAADLDMLILRENTEGLYAGVGGNFKRGTPDEIAINEDVNTRKGVERILRAAFEMARSPGRRKRVCMGDKANAIRNAGDLWQRAFKEVAHDYPDVEASHLYVDVMAMEMVRNPGRFDVIVTNNLFGDILTDLGAALVGGLGLAASANLHPGQTSLFEPVHGSAPDIAGKGVANPLAAMFTAALLLEHVGAPAPARALERAATRAVQEGVVTPDLSPALGAGSGRSTREVGDFVCRALEEEDVQR